VIPTSVLNGEAQSFRRLRQRLSESVHVEAVIGLPREAFVHTDCGVEGALLLFRKLPRAERSAGSTFYWQVAGLGYDRKGRSCAGGDLADLLKTWETESTSHRIATSELYRCDRWDVPWIDAWRSGTLTCKDDSRVPLTALCSVASRKFSRRDIRHDLAYQYFEVSDADIDTGEVVDIHTVTGSEILAKGRLRLRAKAGDVLLPNHRDSLIAKTAKGIGRSAVLASEALDGIITTDRFTALVPKIDPRLLVALLNSQLVRSQLRVYARGSASFDIRDKVLHDVWVPRALLEDETAENLLNLMDERARLTERLSMVGREIEEILSAQG
jgi:type I restriction-modification system DNA methylase subunit